MGRFLCDNTIWQYERTMDVAVMRTPRRLRRTVKERIKKSDVFKLVGLIAFIAVMVAIVIFLRPMLGGIFEEGGTERLVEQIQSRGLAGVVILFLLQFLQMVVAFIPGEVTQIAAGMIYGPWIGALVILIGCVIASSAIFAIVKALGAPFVRDMVPAKYIDKLTEFEKSRKFDFIVFILFLIPGLPKDVFTYILPLTSMKFSKFVALSNLGRIPGIVVSTYAAANITDGNIVTSVVLFAVLAAVSVIGIVAANKLTDKRNASRDLQSAPSSCDNDVMSDNEKAE